MKVLGGSRVDIRASVKPRRWRTRGLTALAITLFACAALAAQAQAATYTVGTNSDLTGTCANPAGGQCSLRQLIDYENGLASNHTPADTIVVPNGSNGAAQFYDLSNGALTIMQNINITGKGARTTQIFQETPSQQGTFRVFDIQPNANAFLPTVTISGLAMFFGKADDSNGDFGGDIRNTGTLTLSEDDIEDGTAASGGGVSNDGGKLTLTHSLVRLNTSSVGGSDSGGIQNFGPNPTSGTPGTLAVDNSTISDNNSQLGGGIFSWCGGSGSNPCANSGTATNTTTITNTTIAGNDGGTRAGTAGGLVVASGTLSVLNSIVANNTVSSGATKSNCVSTGITSLGHNLESGTDCGFRHAGDLQNTDPKFFGGGGSQDNGGNTNTIALDASSPAVDQIPSGSPGCGGTDQRDITRPQGAGCDIGAYELLQPTEGQSFTGVLGSIEAGASSSIDWGDGTPQTAGTTDPNTGQVTGTHTYAEHGIYSGAIHWKNSDGTPITTQFQLKVDDASLSASAVPVTATAGSPFSGQVARVTDANSLAKASDFTATINWGDGSSTAGTDQRGRRRVRGHRYAHLFHPRHLRHAYRRLRLGWRHRSRERERHREHRAGREHRKALCDRYRRRVLRASQPRGKPHLRALGIRPRSQRSRAGVQRQRVRPVDTVSGRGARLLERCDCDVGGEPDAECALPRASGGEQWGGYDGRTGSDVHHSSADPTAAAGAR